MLELCCRLYFTGSIFYSGAGFEDMFWRHDKEIGWSMVPNSDGHYVKSLDRMDGHVTIDQNGLRITNQPQTATLCATILFLGDSTTAGFEVNNDQTYPAVIEQLFSESGYPVRCYNGGVRGYGTDQCFWQLARYYELLKPDLVVYMFAPNDFIDNRTIKQPGRIYGKPAYILENDVLRKVNYPCEQFAPGYYSYIEKDTRGTYVRKDGYVKGDYHPISIALKRWLRTHSALGPLCAQAKRQIVKKFFDKAGTLEIEVTKHDDYDLIVFKKILEQMKQQSNGNLIITSWVRSAKSKKGWKWAQQISDQWPEILSSVASDLDITYINIAPAFTHESSFYHFTTDRHWNTRGHRQAAEALFAELKPLIIPGKLKENLPQ